LLREREGEVVVRDSTEFRHRVAAPDVPLMEGDVGDARALEEAVEQYGIDSVIHFAAYKSPGESMTEPQRYFANVASSTRSQETRCAGRDGSARVLFDLCRLRDGGTGGGGGGRSVRPESPYGERKAMTERALGL
jgi:UDP-glucose 4-epimerase